MTDECHRCTTGRSWLWRCAGVGHVVARRKEYEPSNLLRMEDVVPSGAGAAERPADEAHPIDVAQRTKIVDSCVDIVPIGSCSGELRWIWRRTVVGHPSGA